MTKPKKSRANDGSEDRLQTTTASARANGSTGTPGSSPTGRAGNNPFNAETAPLANGHSPFGKTRTKTVYNSMHLDGDTAGNRTTGTTDGNNIQRSSGGKPPKFIDTNNQFSVLGSDSIADKSTGSEKIPTSINATPSIRQSQSHQSVALSKRKEAKRISKQLGGLMKEVEEWQRGGSDPSVILRRIKKSNAFLSEIEQTVLDSGSISNKMAIDDLRTDYQQIETNINNGNLPCDDSSIESDPSTKKPSTESTPPKIKVEQEPMTEPTYPKSETTQNAPAMFQGRHPVDLNPGDIPIDRPKIGKPVTYISKANSERRGAYVESASPDGTRATIIIGDSKYGRVTDVIVDEELFEPSADDIATFWKGPAGKQLLTEADELRTQWMADFQNFVQNRINQGRVDKEVRSHSSNGLNEGDHLNRHKLGRSSVLRTGAGHGPSGMESYGKSMEGATHSARTGETDRSHDRRGVEILSDHAEGGYNSHHDMGTMCQMPGADTAKMNWSKLPSYLALIQPLKSDQPDNVRTWYNSINTALSASLNVPSILPRFENLNRQSRFEAFLLPPPRNIRYSSLVSIFNGLDQALAYHFEQTIKSTKAPKAAIAIQSSICRDKGFTMLEQILRKTINRLGAMTSRNVDADLEGLQVPSGTSVAVTAQKINDVIGNANANGSSFKPNGPLKALLRIINQDSSLVPYAVQITASLHRFEMEHGQDEPFIQNQMPYDHLNLLSFLEASKAPATISSNSLSNDDGMSAPTIASAKMEWSGTGEDEFENFSREEMLSDIATSLLESESHQFLINDAISYCEDLVDHLHPQVNAMKTSHGKQYCDACERSGHDPDRCFLRGIEFLSPSLQRRIRRYNMVHGSKPKVPPTDTPRRDANEPVANSSMKKRDNSNENAAQDRRVRLPNAKNNALTCDILGNDATGMDHFSAMIHEMVEAEISPKFQPSINNMTMDEAPSENLPAYTEKDPKQIPDSSVVTHEARKDIKVGASGKQSYTARGFGFVCIQFPGSRQKYIVHGLWTPDDTVDTLSCGNLKRFLQLRSCLHEALEWISIEDKNGHKAKIDVNVATDNLEYLKYQIVTLGLPLTETDFRLAARINSVVVEDVIPSLSPTAAEKVQPVGNRQEPNGVDEEVQPVGNRQEPNGVDEEVQPVGNRQEPNGVDEDGNEHANCEDGIEEPVSEASNRPKSGKRSRSRSRRPRTTHRSQISPMEMHLRCHHVNHKALMKMYQSGIYKNMPRPVDLSHDCIICWIAKNTKIHRGPTVSTDNLKVGQRFHLDFWFSNVTSFRGNNCCLTIIDAKSRMLWQFPSRQKRPPLHIVGRFIKLVRSRGLSFLCARTDEDKGLALSADFARLLADASVILEGTGGDNSTNNGKAERPHRTIGGMIRAALIGAGLPDALWDVAAVHLANVHNETWHSGAKDIPLRAWNDAIGVKTEIDFNDRYIFGAKLYDYSGPKKKMDPRTSKDPRKFPTPESDDDEPSPSSLIYVGSGNDKRIILAYDPKTRKVHRLSHAAIDEGGVTLHPNEPISINETMIRMYPKGGAGPAATAENLPPLRQIRSSLLISSTIPREDTFADYDVLLPPTGMPLQIKIFDDDDYGLPLIKVIPPESPLYDQVDDVHRKNVSIVAIDKEEPILASTAAQILTDLRRPKAPTKVTITLCKKEPAARTDLEETRAYHDALAPIIAINESPILQPTFELDVDPVVASATVGGTNTDQSGRVPHYFPEMPPSPKTWAGTRNTQWTHYWNEGAFSEYDRNNEHGSYAHPVLRSTLDKSAVVMPSLLSTKVKKLANHEDTGGVTVAFVARHCAQGNRINPEHVPKDVGNPVATPFAVRQTLANAAADAHVVEVWDASNAFQHVLKPAEERKVYITPGPLMIKWYRDRFPQRKLPADDGSGYVIQLGTSLQGTHAAGLEWYTILRMALRHPDAGFVQCIEEPSIFRLREGNSAMNVVISTDDCLVTSNCPALSTRIKHVMSKFFNMKVHEGAVLSFLNLRLVQTTQGISMDQTEHIESALAAFFPEDERVNPVANYWDLDLEWDLYHSPILTGKELQEIERQFKGSARHHLGVIQHIYNWSRLDLGYFCNRTSSFTAFPTVALFQQIKKAYRCLAGMPHRPIFYPRNIDLRSKSALRQEVSVGDVISVDVPNHLAMFADGGEHKSKYDKRAIGCTIITFGTVATDWKANTLPSLHTSSTNSEIQTYYIAARALTVARPVQNFLGSQVLGAIPIFEDSEPTRAAIQSENVTPRVRHIATYVNYSHEQYVQGMSSPEAIHTSLQVADIGTKPLARPDRTKHHNRLIGVPFYPKAGTEHWRLLKLDRFNKSFRED